MRNAPATSFSTDTTPGPKMRIRLPTSRIAFFISGPPMTRIMRRASLAAAAKIATPWGDVANLANFSITSPNAEPTPRNAVWMVKILAIPSSDWGSSLSFFATRVSESKIGSVPDRINASAASLDPSSCSAKPRSDFDSFFIAAAAAFAAASVPSAPLR